MKIAARRESITELLSVKFTENCFNQCPGTDLTAESSVVFLGHI